MKKIISGASILITGAILFLSACIAGSFNMQSLSGWSTDVGRFWASVSEGKLMPLVVVSIFIMILGTAVILWGNLSKSDSRK